MSRSYKKTPIIKDNAGSESLQWYKRLANKAVRRSIDVPGGKAYKKYFETWNIHDYSFREPFQYYKEKYESSLKHLLNVYGNIEIIPESYKRSCFDFNDNCWKKYYYWK